ncbi:MAG: hypothetical protein AB8F74_03065 [Saprospiraceae bacterium]
MRTVTESITIKALPEFVWHTLLASHEYENWNPIYSFIEGFVELGGQLTIEVDLDVEEALPFMDEKVAGFLKNANKPPVTKRRYKITDYREPHLLGWESKALGGLLFSVSHRFELSLASDEMTLLKTTMTNSGFLSTLMPESFFRNYHKALCMAFNKALKWYVEEGQSDKHRL